MSEQTPPSPQDGDTNSKNPGNNSSSRSNGKTWFGLAPGLVIGIAAALIAVAIGAGIWGKQQSVLSDGNQREATLSGQYNTAAVTLSNCVKNTIAAVGGVKANNQAFIDVVKASIAGKYAVDTSSASRGPLGLQLIQAYPDFKANTALMDKAINTITGCQDDFAGQQKVVLDGVRIFNSWRTGSWAVRQFGGDFPNDNLYVSLPGVNKTGRAALDTIRTPIVDDQTLDAYTSGKQSTTDPFGGTVPTP